MLIYNHTKSKTKEKEYKIWKTLESLQEYTHTHTHTHTGSLNNNKKIYIIKIDRNINPVSILDTG